MNTTDSKGDFDRCAECFMLVKTGEYHPYAACVLYKQLGQADKVAACLNSVIEYGRARAPLAAVEGPKWDKSGLKEACQRALKLGRTHQETDIQLFLDMLLEIERLERELAAASSPAPAGPACERCADDANYLPAYFDEEVKAWLHRGRDNEGYLCRLKHPNGFDEPAEPAQPPKFVSEVDQWKHDLTTAGWVAETALNWRAPDGSLWRGPAGAWKELQRRRAAQPEGEQGKCWHQCEYGEMPYCFLPKGHEGTHNYSLHLTPPATTPPAAPVVAARAADEVVQELFHIGEYEIGTKGRSREWVANLVATTISKHFAATTAPDETAVGGEAHAKNPDAFCLSCNEHPCRLLAAPALRLGEGS